jgi:glycosyltransferase involved in cell wall biosynthesis
MRYAIVIPACNEEPCIAAVLSELRAHLDPARFEIAVGVNGTTDGTVQVARDAGALVAETAVRGYGHGCRAAIDFLAASGRAVDAYIFLAADGANDPADIASLVEAHAQGCEFVLGCRTTRRENWRVMGWQHVAANRFLGFWCACLTGRFFRDIGPLRLIERGLFHAMNLREWTYGWTIEAQMRAVALGAKIREVTVRERRRVAGVQKVSRVSGLHSLKIGAKIILAGFRSRFGAYDRRAIQDSSPALEPSALPNGFTR